MDQYSEWVVIKKIVDTNKDRKIQRFWFGDFMSDIQVSVIVCTYNSKWEKLFSTLMSVLNQKNVNYEIVVADDGSKNSNFVDVENLFLQHEFSQYLLVQHENNVGTVQNLYDAMVKSKGEYVCTISPGDFLYNEFCLSKMYMFARQNSADVCFGNAYFYSYENGLHIYDKFLTKPSRRGLYNEGISNKLKLVGVLWGGGILGAGLFREREKGIKYLKIVLGACKYIDDNSVIPFMVVDGLKILHCNENFIWYEYGTGISTSRNIEWEKKIYQDYLNREELLYKFYSENPVIDAYHLTFTTNSNILRFIRLFVKHPIVLMIYVRMKIMRKYRINARDADVNNLMKLLS